MDQTSFQIVSQAEPKDVFLERCSSTEFQNQPQTSLVFTSDGPELTRHTDHEASEKVNEFTNAFQDSTCRDQQCSAECTFRESESDKLGTSDSANEPDKRKMVSGDLTDEASSDRKGGKGKNVSAGLLAEADTGQVVECVAGEEQINKHSSAEKAFQSQSLKWGIEMDSHEFLSDTLQGKDASSDSGNGSKPVEMEKKTANKTELLQNKTADITVVEDSKMSSLSSKPSVSHKTVQRYLDAHEEKEKIKIKSSNDQNLPSHVLAELSHDYLSMTDDGKLVHFGNAGVQVNTKHLDKTVVEPIQPAKPTSEYVAGLGEGSSKVKDEEDNAETEQRTDSDILLSVLARAQKARPPVLQKITIQESKQETRDDMIPTIVIMPSESPDPTEMKGKRL